ncbi:MAG: hypothetical protein M0R28_21570 [Pigmentiphaga sp.]|nr:hypothetical protein [Pigmentiphaga sp.]
MSKFHGVFLAAITLLATAHAQSNPITFQSEIYLVQEVTGPAGVKTERLTPATKAGGGDLVEFRIFATNSGQTTLPAGVVQIYGPVQDGMKFVADTATRTSRRILTEFSVDGVNFSEPPLLTGSSSNRRVAEPSEYTMIRWTLLVPMEPGQEEPFHYRVLMDGAKASPTSSAEFRILSVTYRWEGDYLFVVGELQNVGGIAMGVELQAIARDASGRLVDTVNFWPASISNIAPGARYGFRYPVTQQRNAATVEVQVVSTITW